MMKNNTKGMRTFLTIWLGQLMSMIGSGLIGFALAIWIFEETRQATPFALTALFSTLPRIALSPIAGAVADRWNRKKIMLIADSLSGLITLTVAILLLRGEMQVSIVYIVSFVGSVLASFQAPAYSASIVMLVPKEQLTRANSLVQTGEAIETIITPLLAGALVVATGMRGIIMIDIATYLFALLTLIFVHIPQPEKTIEADTKPSIFKDIAFGWHYISERRGLLGLLIYFALVNFFMNISAILVGPLVLSFSSAASLGFTQTIMGMGMLAGSLLLSIWGGPKRNRVLAIIGFIALSSLGFFIGGLQPQMVWVGTGLFVLMFFVPFGSGTSAAIFAAKVQPEVQGRVFAMRGMISQSVMPIAFVLSGVLADRVFNPLLVAGGPLAETIVGRTLGVGPGRGIGLMMIISGMIVIVISLLAYANPRIRNIEVEIPDAVPDTTALQESSRATAAAEL